MPMPERICLKMLSMSCACRNTLPLQFWNIASWSGWSGRSGPLRLSLEPQTHDKAVAAVSHLPHVAAAALSLLAARQGDDNLTRLAAGGFRDITRIASSDAGLWSQISLESRDQLLPLIDQYIAILQEFRHELSDGDLDHLRQYFFQASQYRGSLPVDGRGALLTQSILNVYIPDEPGVIGKVTTLLGNHAINITNLRIREFRTYEGGSLQLLLPRLSSGGPRSMASQGGGL